MRFIVLMLPAMVSGGAAAEWVKVGRGAASDGYDCCGSGFVCAVSADHGGIGLSSQDIRHCLVESHSD